MLKKYSAFGLILESEMDLCPMSRAGSDDMVADVSIVFGEVPESGIKNPVFSRVLAHAKHDEAWIHVPGVARFLVQYGRKITVDIMNSHDIDTVNLYLMGSCIGAIIHQRGMVALHASAVEVSGAGILFVGRSGAGKSTTAAIMHHHGCRVISDDTVAISPDGLIAGGYPQLKLWQSSLDSLKIPNTDLIRIRSQVNKYRLPLNSIQSIEEPLSIKAVYVLIADNEKENGCTSITELKGLEKFQQLQRHTYRARIMAGLGGNKSHLVICSKLAKSTYMAYVRRPTSYFSGQELVKQVLVDIENNNFSNA